MGSGSYYTIIYGCADRHKLTDDGDKQEKIEEIFDELDLTAGYENTYVGIRLLITLSEWSVPLMPGGPVALTDLATTFQAAIKPAKLKAAEALWAKAIVRVAELGVTLPPGQVLWAGDYD